MDQDVKSQRSYPNGVPCWIDTEQADLPAATRFYAGLFGWTFEDVMPAEAPGSYQIAKLDGQEAAAIGSGVDPIVGPAKWNTYISVDDADATAAAIAAAGGTVLVDPYDPGPGGRTATCADPLGAEFGLWQPRLRWGVQVANQPGAWNFSNLHTTDPERAMDFYAAVFGWVAEPLEGTGAAMVRVPGYGDHLAATTDPDIHERQASAPPGFADVIGGLETVASDAAMRWHVVFTVASRDESAATAERLGATVRSHSETIWTKNALVVDPQGAEFTLSQFTPPD